MNLATLRLGKDSVHDIEEIDALSSGAQSIPYEFSTTCTQVPESLQRGSLVVLWLGSDNSKGRQTPWRQGFRAVGRVLSVDGTEYREETKIALSIGYIFDESIGRKDFLREAPQGYYWCSDVPVIGVDDRANQTVRTIDDGTFSSIGALMFCFEQCEPGFRTAISATYPELTPHLSFVPPDPKTAPPSGHVLKRKLGELLEANTIYFGAPGTGKSYQLNQLAATQFPGLDSRGGERRTRVTFHPRYTYHQFVGTYKPVARSVPSQQDPNVEVNEISYAFVPGPFAHMLVKSLNNPREDYVLILEEINRADTASVFGDIFQLLDRTAQGSSAYPIEVSLEFGEFLLGELSSEGREHLLAQGGKIGATPSDVQIVLPQNLYIWATMNSADQGVFPLDSAFKRRWGFRYVGIDDGADMCTWDAERRAINSLLKSTAKVNEDKLVGPFFLSNAIRPRGDDNGMSQEFRDAFATKVLMYLVEDAAKYSMQSIVRSDRVGEDAVLSDYIHAWNSHNFGMFNGLESWTTSVQPAVPVDPESTEPKPDSSSPVTETPSRDQE